MWGGRERSPRQRDEGSYGSRDASFSPRESRGRDTRSARRDNDGESFAQEEGSDSGSPFRLTTDRRVGQGRDEYKDRAKHHWKGRGKKGSKTTY